jgi:hypothetical protein
VIRARHKVIGATCKIVDDHPKKYGFITIITIKLLVTILGFSL